MLDMEICIGFFKDSFHPSSGFMCYPMNGFWKKNRGDKAQYAIVGISHIF